MNKYLLELKKQWKNFDSEIILPDLREPARQKGIDDFPYPVCCRTLSQAYLESEPALKNLSFDVLSDLRIALAGKNNIPHVTIWAEKLLRVCEIRRLSLKQRLASNGESGNELQIKTLVLCIFFLEYFSFSNDPRYVNITLKIMDLPWTCSLSNSLDRLSESASGENSKGVLACCVYVLMESAISTISQPSWTTDIVFPDKDNMKPLPGIGQNDNATIPKRVVVFSPSRFSLYTLGIIGLLLRKKIKVEAVIIRKLFNSSRFFLEIKRDGKRLLVKIWKKLFLRRRAYNAPMPFQTIADLLSELQVKESSVDSLAKANNIEVQFCKDLNEPCVHKVLERIQPDVVLFSGGGLIRQGTLERSGGGVVNCHMGQLPTYKGMDVVEWPLLENHVDTVGFTVHFMDKGVDTGDILGVYSVPVDVQSISKLRMKMETFMTKAIVDATANYLTGMFQPIQQDTSEGRQYFIMHERLYAIAQERLSQNRSN